MNDAIGRFGAVAAVGFILGILFHTALVVSSAIGTPAGIIVSGAVGAALLVAVDFATDES